MQMNTSPTIRQSDIEAAIKSARAHRSEALGDLISKAKARISEIVHGNAAATGTTA
ncbi:MAG: RSP_7527 family protein [Magnetovibrionaceae bacterium]